MKTKEELIIFIPIGEKDVIIDTIVVLVHQHNLFINVNAN